MLTRVIRIQLALFAIVTMGVIVALGWYYLRIPAVVGIGQYTLYTELPRSGGLYKTANVTYRGITIGKVTAVEPTEHGARATMSISDRYKISLDASANVHSVSAAGEQYVDLVSTGNPAQYFRDGQTITNSTVPSEIGPTLDAVNQGLAVLPKEKIASLLDETSKAVGGLGPSLQRLVDATQAIVHDFRTNIDPANDIIAHAAPILDSQARSGDALKRWSANLNVLAAQSAEQDTALRGILENAAPTADAVNKVFSDVRESLPQTLANAEVVFDMLKRYHNNLELIMVALPQAFAGVDSTTLNHQGWVDVNFRTAINQPPPCLTGFLPATEWRSPADTSMAELPTNSYCKIPQDFQGNVVRGARNYPCADVPGKRAATPRECRSKEPYVPLGTNPWYGDPMQILNCPAPGARCDQAVKPGFVIPAPSINNGMNPLPADKLPQPPPPRSDPLSRPGRGTVQCLGGQPDQCFYTTTPGPAAMYRPQSGEVTTPDGAKFTVSDSTSIGDDGWKDMLAPAG